MSAGSIRGGPGFPQDEGCWLMTGTLDAWVAGSLICMWLGQALGTRSGIFTEVLWTEESLQHIKPGSS